METMLVNRKVTDTKDRVFRLIRTLKTARDRDEISKDTIEAALKELNIAHQDLQSAQTMLVHQ